MKKYAYIAAFLSASALLGGCTYTPDPSEAVIITEESEKNESPDNSQNENETVEEEANQTAPEQAEEGQTTSEQGDNAQVSAENEQDAPNTTEDQVANIEESDDNTAGDFFGTGYSSWNEGYLDYLDKTTPEGYDDISYSFIYVDDDDIPELVVDTGFEAGGCQIVAYHDGTVNVLQTARLYFTYIEKSGLLCNTDGHMGYYYDNVYSLEDGTWKCILSGDWTEYSDLEDPKDEEEYVDSMVRKYYISEEEVDEKTYGERIDAVYDRTSAKEPEHYLRIDDVRAYISTGKLASAEHRYELFVEDCTWEEAAKKCEEKGGYLVSMTSDEEFEKVDNLIRSQDLQNISFYIGATNTGDSTWYHWIDQSLTVSSCHGKGYRRHWLAGQPSYRETLEDGTEVEEHYAEYIYRKSDDKFYINDIPSDVISYYPSYKGYIGYICEFD